MISTLVRDYLLECAKEHKWIEESYNMGLSDSSSMQSGRFSRDFGERSIYEQTMNWTFLVEKVSLRKTSTDGLYYEEILSVNLCNPDSLEILKSYFEN